MGYRNYLAIIKKEELKKLIQTLLKAKEMKAGML